MVKLYEKYAAKPDSLSSIAAKFENKTAKDRKRTYYYSVINPNGKKTVVYLHGLSAARFDAAPMVREIARQNPDVAIYLPDLLNHGDYLAQFNRDKDGALEKKPNSALRGIEHFAKFSDISVFLDDFLRAINRTPDLIIGHSFGAALVYDYFARGMADAKTHAILLAPTPKLESLPRKLEKIEGLLPDSVASALWGSDFASYLRIWVMRRGCSAESNRFSDRQINTKLRESEFLRGENKLMDTEHELPMTDLMVKENIYYRDRISPKDQKRMTVVYGKHDMVVSDKGFADLRTKLIPRARFFERKNSGHLLHVESIDFVGKLSRELLHPEKSRK